MMIISENIHSLKSYVVQKFKGHRVMMDSIVYLVKGEKTALIDTSHFVTAEGLIQKMRYLTDFDVEDLSYILLTHSHADHSGGLSLFKRCSTKALVACHESGKDSVEVYGGVTPDLSLHNGDRIDLGDGQVISVIHSPGHSQDSLCFLTSKEKALIVGDSVGPGVDDAFERIQSADDDSFGGPYVERIPWLGVLNDAAAYIDTLNTLGKIDFNILLPGHGVPFSGSMAKQYLDRCVAHFDLVDKIITEIPENDYKLLVEQICKKYVGLGFKGLPREPWNMCVFTFETVNAFLRRQGRL